MLRKFVLPVFAIVLLGGCMTGGYSYRQDRGDYYYGQPGVDYRYYDRYGSGSFYDPRYRYPGYYPSYYGGYGGYGYGYYRPPVIVVRPGHGHGNHNNRPPRPDRDRGNDRAPWRDYERLQRERIQRSTPPPVGNPTSLRAPVPAQVRPAAQAGRPAAPPAPRSNDRGSRMDRAIERARSSRQEE
ncbi:MAG: hypothetical protein ACOH1P_06100 [Lysobacter sp.]